MRKHGKKGVSDIQGLRAIRTLHSSSKRSIPRGYQGSSFLDLYMLAKEKGRLEKENSIIDRRNRVIQQRLKDIEQESERLKALEAPKLAEGGRAMRKSIPAVEGPIHKEWKKLALHY